MKAQDKEAERAFFDKIAESEEYDVFTDKGYDKILQEFIKLVSPKPREKMAELGCATGAFTKRFVKLGLDVTGVDISPKCIEVADKKIPRAKFVVADIEKLPFKNKSFDIVVYAEVLHHFMDATKTLKEAYRILKPGGRCFAADPHAKNPIMWLYRSEKSPIHSKKGRTSNERLLDENIVKEYIKAGFKEVYTRSISGVPYKYVESRTGRILLIPYNTLDFIMGKTPLAKKYGSVLISFAVK